MGRYQCDLGASVGALGASEVNLLELTGAYLPLANGGRGGAPFAVTEIRTRGGQVVYRQQPWPDDRLIATQNVARMNEMLSDVIISGTGRAANLGSRPAAGKTGTTQDYRDAWFIGYTADLVTGVWLGNDDNAPMRNVGGGDLPARIWRQYMIEASRDLPVRPLRDSDDGELVATSEILQRVASWFRRSPARRRIALPGRRRRSGGASSCRSRTGCDATTAARRPRRRRADRIPMWNSGGRGARYFRPRTARSR
jgi:membrane peptidoglycan carboxypeptidase